jgi:hypothetical protein
MLGLAIAGSIYMPLSDETAFRLLPVGRPPIPLARSGEELARLTELEGQTGPDAPLPRILDWHILIAATLRNTFDKVANTLTAQAWGELFELVAGYVALAPEQYADPLINAARKNEDYVFGAALFDYRGHPYQPIRRSMDMGDLDSRLHGLPLVHVPVADIFHAAPNVNLATSTCWAATSIPPGGKPDHILTAAHNVHWQGRGHRVAFNGGLTGQVVRSASHPVDAALIAPNFLPPALSVKIQVESVPVPTEPFSFDGSKSGSVAR